MALHLPNKQTANSIAHILKLVDAGDQPSFLSILQSTTGEPLERLIYGVVAVSTSPSTQNPNSKYEVNLVESLIVINEDEGDLHGVRTVVNVLSEHERVRLLAAAVMRLSTSSNDRAALSELT